MLEVLGIVFGGVSRLAQHWMEMKDKDKEREHEAVMFDKQAALQAQRTSAEQDLRKMDAQAKQDQGELDALIAAIQSQAGEAQAAGGWAARLSASVRPVISYWLLAIYTLAKCTALYLALSGGMPVAQAIQSVYSEFDGALMGSIMAFWFADRSLRKAK